MKPMMLRQLPHEGNVSRGDLLDVFGLMVAEIDPEQEFFPKPNEVADEIERQISKKLPSHIYARG